MANDIDKRSDISNDPNRPIEFGDGILAWIDEETGLMWEVKNIDNIKHGYVWSEEWIEKAFFPKLLTDNEKDAFSYVEKLNNENYVGFDDWRLPTKEELESLQGKHIYALKIEEKPLSKNTNWYYWSSDSDTFNNKAWTVCVYYGGSECFDKNDDKYVRCVRDLRDDKK